MEEIWKDIPGYEGKYQISNCGRVKSLNYKNTGKENILKPLKDKCGYQKINLYNQKTCTYRIHRLVAENFIEKPLLEVNHLNGNKEDNRVKNLEWCTHSENERHSWRVLGRKTKNIYRKHLGKKVIQYYLKDNYIKAWESAAEAGRTLNIRSNKILACCRKERNQTGGYKWRFENK